MGLLQQTAQMTPQGQQAVNANQANQQLIASGQSSLQSGQTLTPDVANATQNAFGQVNQQMQNTQTPGARQGYLDATNLGAAQGNYDALAKQLASYDSSVLQPQFAGANPGQSSDMPYNPLGYTPNISYLTPSTPTGVYDANPTFGLNAQADQGNSIVNLLGTLSKTIANETSRGTNKYTSDLKSLASMLGPLNDILTQNTNLSMKKAELAEAAASRANSAANKAPSPLDLKKTVLAALQQVQGPDLHVSPTDYARIKNEAGLIGVDAKDFDSWAQQYRNPDQAKLFPTDAYQVDPAALTAQERTANQKVQDQQVATNNLNGFADEIMTNWGKMSPEEKAMGMIPGLNQVGALAPNIIKNDSVFYDQMIKNLKASIGGRLTNQEINLFHQQIPGPLDSAETAQYKINTLKGMVAAKLSNPSSTVTSPSTNSGNTKVVNGVTYAKQSDGLWHKQ